MDEPHTSFEPQTASPMTGENLAAATETTNLTSKFESTNRESETRRAADDLKSAARAAADAYRSKAEQAWGNAQERARSFQNEIEQEVRANPVKAIFSVLGIGFLLGLIFRR